MLVGNCMCFLMCCLSGGNDFFFLVLFYVKVCLIIIFCGLDVVWFFDLSVEWFIVVNLCLVSGVVVCLLKCGEDLFMEVKLFEIDKFVMIDFREDLCEDFFVL